MRLLVFLGNPGGKYANNRHNVGFLFGDWFAAENRVSLEQSGKFQALTGRTQFEGEEVTLLFPLTFMNKSGSSVAAICKFYKIPPEKVCVVYDELEIEFGNVKRRMDGGHGGHNGIRDIINKLGTKDFARVKIGISRPPAEWGPEGVSRWVLGDFATSDLTELEPKIWPEVVDRIQSIFTQENATQ